MCVLICANPITREWLVLVSARSYRQSLPLTKVCPDEPIEIWGLGSGYAAGDIGNGKVSTLPCVMKRSAWIQAYCARIAAQEQRLAQQRGHKSLDAITNAWIRLLALVGLR
jgi:hypothetical protein